METPVAILAPGFNPLSQEIGRSLATDFTVNLWDKFDSEERDAVVADQLSYGEVGASTESDLLHALQGAIALGDIRLLVNVIDYRDFEIESSLEQLSPSLIRSKVTARIETILNASKVIALQMACQTKIDGYKGQIIIVFNFDSEESLQMCVVQDVIASIVGILGKVLQGFGVRLNIITILPPAPFSKEACEVAAIDQAKEMIKTIALDSTVCMQHFVLRTTDCEHL